MRLLAAYIKKLGNLFENSCFNFSSDHEIKYDNDILNIVNLDGKYNNFYGEEIRDISVIVGKNGTGKTTLLNMLGNPMEERIQAIDMDKKGINDSYFILYESEEGIFYLERVGKFSFINIEGNDSKREIDSFFFKIDENNNYKIVNEFNITDRIIYLTDEQKSIPNLSRLYWGEQQNIRLMPRCKRRIAEIAKWYKAYIHLFKIQMVQSFKIEVRFFVNQKRKINSSTEEDFLIQCKVNEEATIYNTIDYYGYIEEIFDDFLSNHINMIMRLFLNVLYDESEKNEGKKEAIFESIYEFKKEYDQKIIDWNQCKIKKIFKKLSLLFDDLSNVFVGEYESFRFYKDLITAYSDFYTSIYAAKEFIVPGVDQFSLIMNGIDENILILQVCEAYDAIQNIYIKQSEEWNALEERRYDNADEKNRNKLEFDRLYSDIIPCISSGEEKIISIISDLTSELQRNFEIDALSRKEKTLLFIIDEIERDMHPEWSRQLIYYIYKYLSQYTYKLCGKDWSLKDLNVKIQLVMSTHSPFLISDLIEKSVIKLEKEENGMIRQRQTYEKVFAQNIQRIITNDFFVDGYCGQFAEEKINNLIRILSDEDKCKKCDEKKMKRCFNEIEEIGDPIIKDKLNQMFEEYFDLERKKEKEIINCIKNICGPKLEIDMDKFENMLKKQYK